MGRSRGKKGAGLGPLLRGIIDSLSPEIRKVISTTKEHRPFLVRTMNELLMAQRKSYLVVEAVTGG